MRFGILGPLQAVDDDGLELALGGRMPRAVLALLLLRANEVVSSDQLVEELWAGAPPASGAKGLHVHVSRLRRALAAGHSDPGGERLVTTAGGYVLRVGPEELDVQRCERLIGEGRSLLAARRPDQAIAAPRRLGRLSIRRVRAGRDRAARRAARRRAGGADRGRNAAGPGGAGAGRARASRARLPVPRASAGPAYAGSVSDRTAGGSAGRLPCRPVGAGR